MIAANATLFVFLAVGAVCFIAGVAFAGAIVWIETRKWRRPFAGINPAGNDDGCTVYGHYDDRGVLHIDRVEIDGEARA